MPQITPGVTPGMISISLPERSVARSQQHFTSVKKPDDFIDRLFSGLFASWSGFSFAKGGVLATQSSIGAGAPAAVIQVATIVGAVVEPITIIHSIVESVGAAVVLGNEVLNYQKVSREEEAGRAKAEFYVRLNSEYDNHSLRFSRDETGKDGVGRDGAEKERTKRPSPKGIYAGGGKGAVHYLKYSKAGSDRQAAQRTVSRVAIYFARDCAVQLAGVGNRLASLSVTLVGLLGRNAVQVSSFASGVAGGAFAMLSGLLHVVQGGLEIRHASKTISAAQSAKARAGSFADEGRVSVETLANNAAWETPAGKLRERKIAKLTEAAGRLGKTSKEELTRVKEVIKHCFYAFEKNQDMSIATNRRAITAAKWRIAFGAAGIGIGVAVTALTVIGTGGIALLAIGAVSALLGVGWTMYACIKYRRVVHETGETHKAGVELKAQARKLLDLPLQEAESQFLKTMQTNGYAAGALLARYMEGAKQASLLDEAGDTWQRNGAAYKALVGEACHTLISPTRKENVDVEDEVVELTRGTSEDGLPRTGNAEDNLLPRLGLSDVARLTCIREAYRDFGPDQRVGLAHYLGASSGWENDEDYIPLLLFKQLHGGEFRASDLALRRKMATRFLLLTGMERIDVRAIKSTVALDLHPDAVFQIIEGYIVGDTARQRNFER
ncbi:hypothetical protein PQQ99_36300 [Paraburkholderia sediminicola]|uniref:hypothetical protein n=1 Tax=Paraburkholderia sediminicola TaxID=458836 RepID=UPI0038B6DEB5